MSINDLFVKEDPKKEARQNTAKALKKHSKPTTVVNADKLPDYIRDYYRATPAGVPQLVRKSLGRYIAHSVFSK